MTKSKIAALIATLALGAFAAGCSTATNENMNKPANTTPANTTKPANLAPPANSNTGAKPPANANKMPPPKPSATKKP
jgi:PBP1b-binding outer membrane lipoprotein LpoB